MSLMKYVTITIGGWYLAPGPDETMTFRAQGPGMMTIWERIDLTAGRVAFRNLDGYFLANPPSEGWAYWKRDAIGAWETFEEVWWPDDSVSIRTQGRFFLSADNGGGQMTSIKQNAGPWERFWYEKPPDGLLPGSGNAQPGEVSQRVVSDDSATLSQSVAPVRPVFTPTVEAVGDPVAPILSVPKFINPRTSTRPTRPKLPDA